MTSRVSWGIARLAAVAGLAAGVWGPVPAAAAEAADKIAPALAARVAGGGSASALVLFGPQARFASAARARTWTARGAAVYGDLRRTADSAQARAVALLAGRGVPFRRFAVVDAIQVTADRATLEALAALPEVALVREERTLALPPSRPGQTRPRAGTVEWNVARIGADRVWNEFGVTGDGVVVGTIDSGVDYLHPAVAGSYRGNLGGGTWVHDYNWWDGYGVCGGVPCDDYGHGTHTMGTAVGGDGPGPFLDDIGVAPGARWITAKGCGGDGFCTESALLSSGEFMLAPTDRNGNAPDPARRPHIVSNSWGGGPGDPLFQEIVRVWRAAGMMPVFSVGNAGPGCGSAGSPGDFLESFAVGATDFADAVAWFSSRGPSVFGPSKPDVSAPGVDVRSSVPGGGYESWEGTSMAAPHVAGMVALLWSANPALVGDLDTTAAVLRETALDIPDLTCGGDPDGDPNNVSGDGRIDAYGACIGWCGPHGTLVGLVTDAATGAPIAGASVRAVRRDDGFTSLRASDADGRYRAVLPVDPPPGPEAYEVVVGAFGYSSADPAFVEVSEDETRTLDVALTSLPRYVVSGRVLDADTGAPLEGVTVQLVATPLPAVVSAADGRWAIPGVPAGSYDVAARGGSCFDPGQLQVEVTGDTAAGDLPLAARRDRFGYQCRIVPVDWVDTTDVVPLRGDDATAPVTVPFQFPLYGEYFGSPAGALLWVSTNGAASFTDSYIRFWNTPLPDYEAPGAALYPFWTDLYVGYDSQVRTALLGTRPNRRFVVEWDGVNLFGSSDALSFEAILSERDGSIVFQYRNPSGPGAYGRYSTIGIENRYSDDAFQYSHEQPAVSDGLAIRFIPPPMDTDGDGILDSDDLCRLVYDPEQRDGDGDAVGDACDDCPATYDPAQTDGDGDRLGDACDPCPASADCDDDGYADGTEVARGSDLQSPRSTPEGEDVLGTCLDGDDNDDDGRRDFRARSLRGDPDCDRDGDGLLDQVHQVVVTRTLRAPRIAVGGATGSMRRVARIHAAVQNPLDERPSASRGLPAGETERVLVSLERALVDPALRCTTSLNDDPQTGEHEDQPSRLVVLRPRQRGNVRWLLVVDCEPGHEPVLARDALRLRLRVSHTNPSLGLLDEIHTAFANVAVE